MSNISAWISGERGKTNNLNNFPPNHIHGGTSDEFGVPLLDFPRSQHRDDTSLNYERPHGYDQSHDDHGSSSSEKHLVSHGSTRGANEGLFLASRGEQSQSHQARLGPHHHHYSPASGGTHNGTYTHGTGLGSESSQSSPFHRVLAKKKSRMGMWDISFRDLQLGEQVCIVSPCVTGLIRVIRAVRSSSHPHVSPHPTPHTHSTHCIVQFVISHYLYIYMMMMAVVLVRELIFRWRPVEAG